MRYGKCTVFYTITETINEKGTLDWTFTQASIELRNFDFLLDSTGGNVKLSIGVEWLSRVHLFGWVDYEKGYFSFDMSIKEYNERRKWRSDWSLCRELILTDNPHLNVETVI